MKTTDKIRIEKHERQRSVVGKLLLVTLLGLFIAGCSKKPDAAGSQARADGYFKEGKLDEARIEYMNLLRADKQSAVAYQQLGTIWFEQGAPLQAVPFLWRARELLPSDLGIRSKLGAAMLAVGDVAAARKEAASILDQSPTHEEALMLMAETAFNKEDIDGTMLQLSKGKEPDRAVVHLVQAILAARQGDVATAEAEVRKALELDPKSVHAHMALANLLLGKKDFAGAGEELKKAADLSPARSQARIRFAEFKLATGAVAECKALLTEMTKNTKDYLPPWRLLAQIAFAEKKYDEALALLENVFGRDPKNIESRLLQSQIWTVKGDTKKAVEVLEVLRSTYKMLPAVQLRLAQAYAREGNFTQAGIALKELVAIQPDFTEAILLLAEVSIRNGEAGNAVELMKGLLQKRPGLLQAQMLLADAYRILGRLDDAAAIFREQISLAPTIAGPHFMLGTVLRMKGNLMEARLAFEEAQKLAPDNLNASYQLVEMDILGKNFTAAHKRTQIQLAKMPDKAGAHFLSGWTHAAQRHFDEAEVALLKAIELDPKFAKAYELLISTYIDAGKLDQAMSRIEGRLARKPDDVTALLTSAAIHERLKNYPKARDAYEKVLTVNPDYIGALNNLAVLYTEQFNDLDRAYELARKARTLLPEEPSVADTLGWIVYKRADYKQALALFSESAGKMPENPEIQFHLGMANYMMGQTETARKALQRAVSSPTDFTGKEEARRRLALLGDSVGKPAQLPVEELEALVKQQPNDLLTRVRLGEAYETQGAFEKAVAAYEEALQLNSKMLAPMLKLAALYLGPVPNPAKALDLAKKARSAAPSDPVALVLLGRANFQTGGFSLAYGFLLESTRKAAADPALLRDFAWSAYYTGKSAEAQANMERIVKATPDSPHAGEARSFLAMAALGEAPKESAAAEPEIQKILDANPTHVPALMARAALQVQKGDRAAAEGIYSEIITRLPDFAPAQRNLAALYVENPATREKASALATKARRTLPDDPDVIRTLAELNFHKKEFTGAVRLFEEADKKRPLDPKGLYYLGMSHAQAKDKPKAADALKRALGAGLSGPMASEAKRQLTELGI